jgi:hypothetical protein
MIRTGCLTNTAVAGVGHQIQPFTKIIYFIHTKLYNLVCFLPRKHTKLYWRPNIPGGEREL